MLKPLIIFMFFIFSCLAFRGVIYAQEKADSRVLYEENTTFEEAKRRAKALSEINAENPEPGEQNPKQNKAADEWMEKMLPMIEKFLGADAAGLLREYRKGPKQKSNSGLESQTEKGEFREFSDKHKWKGLRRQ